MREGIKENWGGGGAERDRQRQKDRERQLKPHCTGNLAALHGTGIDPDDCQSSQAVPGCDEKQLFT